MSPPESLPHTWIEARLDEISEVILGQSPPGSSYNTDGIGFPFFQGSAEFGNLFPEVRKWTTEATKVAQAGDVLLSVRAPVGPTNLAPFECAIGRGVAALRSADGVEPKYLLYAMRATESSLAARGTGSTFTAVSGPTVREHRVPLAPTAEQRRIVAAIEEQFSRIDAGGEALHRAHRNLQRMQAAVLQAALTGRLVHQNPEDEPVETLLKRLDQHPGTQGGKPSGARVNKSPAPPNERLLPRGWAWVRLEMVAVTSSGGTPRRDRPDYFGGSIPWVKSGELRDGLVHETAEYLTHKGLANSSAQIVPRRTLMIALYGATVGKLGILDMDLAATNQAVCTIQPVISEMRDYLWWVLRHYRTDLIFQGRGGAQPNISQEILRKLVLPLPPLAEQQRIVEHVERHWSVLRDVDAAIVESVHRSERLRRSMLSRAFQGRLVPQDPSDEPAVVLLERIGAARTTDGSKQHRARRPSR